MFACAIQEELRETFLYFSQRCKHSRSLSHMLKTTFYDSQYREGSDITAFEISDDCHIILLCTGGGVNQTRVAFQKLLQHVQVSKVFFAGCALGLTSNVVLGDELELLYAVDYDNDTTPECFERVEDILANHIHQTASCAIALSGKTFVNVSKQRRILQNSTKKDNSIADISPLLSDEYAVLPESARVWAQHCLQWGKVHNKEIHLVLDMESATLFDTMSSAIPYPTSVLRIVLDTIYDTQAVDFYKAIAQISTQICQWFLGKSTIKV